MKKHKILVVNGPNLSLLGTREPAIYGTETLGCIASDMRKLAEHIGGIELEFFQSDSEGALVTCIGATRGIYDGIIINPAAYTHTSLAIADAISAVSDVVPCIEVHLSNTHQREEIRHKSLTASSCIGQIMGFKGQGYSLAMLALKKHLTA